MELSIAHCVSFCKFIFRIDKNGSAECLRYPFPDSTKETKEISIKTAEFNLGFRFSFVAQGNSVSTDRSVISGPREGRGLRGLLCLLLPEIRRGQGPIVNKTPPTLWLLLQTAQAEPWQGAESCDWLITKKGWRSLARLALEAPCYLTAF